jgi:protein-S-isoprenylcysteine O-methyltransferase Ste14
MRRLIAVLGSAVFLLIAPGTLAMLIPWWMSHWRFRSQSAWWVPLQAAGTLLIAFGLPVLLDSFARFALQGLGTPAPVLPPQRLVISGLYRRVRNPMYVAVVSIILGQSLLFGSLQLFEYCAVVWVFFHLFVLAYEEPALRAKFGNDYDRFRANVPRWIPHLRPWNGSTYSETPDPDSTVPRPRSSVASK